MTDQANDAACRRVLDALTAFEQGAGSTSLAQVSEAASAFIGADEASCVVWKPKSKEVVLFDCYCAEPQKMADYAEHYAIDDPLVDVGMRTPTGSWVVADEIFSDAKFSKNAFLGEFLPKYRVGQVMALALRVTPELLASFSFHRQTKILTTAATMQTGKTKAFSDAATRALGQTFSHAAATRTAVGEAVSAPNCFCALVNSTGSFMPLAGAPHDRLVVQNVFNASDGRMRHAQARSQARLVTLIMKALNGSPGSIVMPGGPNGPLLVEARLAPEGIRVGSEPLAFLTIRTRSPLAVPAVEDLQALHGLTPMEALVLQSLCSGMTMAQTADQLGKGLSTVRTHVANAMGKMGCTRQSDLVRLAMLGVIN